MGGGAPWIPMKMLQQQWQMVHPKTHSKQKSKGSLLKIAVWKATPFLILLSVGA